MHTHLLVDGSMVTHAHPFDRSGESESGESHEHSNLEYVLFQNLEILFFSTLLSIAVKKSFSRIDKRDLIPAVYTSPIIFLKYGRAPPQM